MGKGRSSNKVHDRTKRPRPYGYGGEGKVAELKEITKWSSTNGGN